jgi:hypothetical protein
VSRRHSRTGTLGYLAAIVALLAARWLTGLGGDHDATTPAMRRSTAGAPVIASHDRASMHSTAASSVGAPPHLPLRAAPYDATALNASLIRHRYETASDYRALFDELMRTDASEGRFFAAKILVDCLEVADDGYDTVLRRFVAGVPRDSPNAAARIAAFRRMKEPCAGFSGRTPSSAEIEQLFAAGARDGDVRALSQLLVTDRPEPGADPSATIARLLDSRDPYVLGNIATYIFAANRMPVVIDGRRVDPPDLDAAQFAWDLVACDHGLPCGPDGKAVLHICAHDGLCNAETFEDLVRAEFGILASFDRVQYFRNRILDALAARDYGSLGVR